MSAIIPYSPEEYAYLKQAAHRHLLTMGNAYRWARKQVNNPESIFPDNGTALNICRNYKTFYRGAANRLQAILYDVERVYE